MRLCPLALYFLFDNFEFQWQSFPFVLLSIPYEIWGKLNASLSSSTVLSQYLGNSKMLLTFLYCDFNLKMTDSGKSKKFEKITKKGKQKKRAQAASRTVNSSRADHIPLINPTSQSHSTLPPPVPQSQPIPTPAPHSTTPEPTQSQPIPTPAPHSTTPEPTQPQSIPTQVPHTQESPVINQTPASSSSHATGGNNENKIVIVPEGDGFDKHKLVISNIASCIRKKFDEAKPSWKMSIDQRDTWFDMFQKDFTWLPQYNDMVRRNFEKRGSAKLTQLLQKARKNLDRRPSWIGDSVWARLKQHWQSSEFKKKSETNKRNRDSMAGA
ncbi:hypothetical protein RIF29_20827 [Crotalaria pallida]|uniref:Uncharacterized protein n=1 Tax=Crotalaria pallida TaxID=3830 RepID=A0AAN9F6B9_CROPI